VIYKIRIDGLSVFGYHGVQQHEKDFGQEFLIDIHLDVDSGLEDSIESTVSYAAIADLVTELSTRMRFDLVESLARTLLNACLKFDPRVLRATVTVHKPHAPLSQKFHDVSVTLAGSRDEN
jgi:dihydroneopterin aldolase